MSTYIMKIKNVIRLIKDYIEYCRNKVAVFMNNSMKLKGLHVMTPEETVKYIIDKKCSVCRFGDGEFAVMAGGCNGFQKNDNKLQNRLIEVISDTDPHILNCINYSLTLDMRNYSLESKKFQYGWMAQKVETDILPFVSPNYRYGDTLFTRFYMHLANKTGIPEYVSLLKQIWNQQDICIIEGYYSRLGVQNDLFDNACSIIRILGPERDAFDKYQELFEAGKKYGKNRLLLLALGMTATVLAHDFAKAGLHAIDIGHVDVEYMWWKMNAKTKMPVHGRYVNEAGQVREDINDIEYNNQIVLTI